MIDQRCYNYLLNKHEGSVQMSNIDWIFFDMGYTLVNEDGAHEVRISLAKDELAEQGIIITSEQVWQEAYRYGSMFKSPIPHALRHFGAKNIKMYSTEEGEEAYEDALPALLELKKNHKLGIIANQPAGAADRLRRYGLLGCFDAVFGSDDVGLKKPDVEFYKYAIKSVGCSADRAVMVGDRPDNDIEPATEAGMHTVRILRGFFKNAPDKIKPDHTIISLTQLCDIYK